LRSINQSSRVTAEWIPGATGKEKAKLFQSAHIFVLPTRYKVEAQPLAVIEAMAWGSAIITTAVGELPSTVDQGCASIIVKPTAESVAMHLERLIADDEYRLEIALAGLRRFSERFNRETYIDNWMEIMSVTE
ncbi:MAG: glycosyltransferase family 4 protein, partial [Opitutales bacterium]